MSQHTIDIIGIAGGICTLVGGMIGWKAGKKVDGVIRWLLLSFAGAVFTFVVGLQLSLQVWTKKKLAIDVLQMPGFLRPLFRSLYTSTFAQFLWSVVAGLFVGTFLTVIIPIIQNSVAEILKETPEMTTRELLREILLYYAIFAVLVAGLGVALTELTPWGRSSHLTPLQVAYGAVTIPIVIVVIFVGLPILSANLQGERMVITSRVMFVVGLAAVLLPKFLDLAGVHITP